MITHCSYIVSHVDRLISNKTNAHVILLQFFFLFSSHYFFRRLLQVKVFKTQINVKVMQLHRPPRGLIAPAPFWRRRMNHHHHHRTHTDRNTVYIFIYIYFTCYSFLPSPFFSRPFRERNQEEEGKGVCSFCL